MAEFVVNKDMFGRYCRISTDNSAYYLDDVLFNDIDNLAKEMVGTKNEN